MDFHAFNGHVALWQPFYSDVRNVAFRDATRKSEEVSATRRAAVDSEWVLADLQKHETRQSLTNWYLLQNQ